MVARGDGAPLIPPQIANPPKSTLRLPPASWQTRVRRLSAERPRGVRVRRRRLLVTHCRLGVVQQVVRFVVVSLVLGNVGGELSRVKIFYSALRSARVLKEGTRLKACTGGEEVLSFVSRALGDGYETVYV